jgi:DNA polymerase III subunit epsilon
MSIQVEQGTGGPTPARAAPALAPTVSGTHPLSSARFAVVDVETSGLRPQRHRLLQIGVVVVDGTGVVEDRWETLLKAPWRPLGPRHVHGLTRRQLRGAPPFRAVTAELTRRLDGTIVCAHNVSFDWPFLTAALARAGYDAPDGRRLCTLELSRSLDPERTRSHRLGDLCLRYDVPLVRAHDAAHDAAATAAILPRLLEEAGIHDTQQLGPFLAGATSAWPAPSAARPRRSLRHPLRRS